MAGDTDVDAIATSNEIAGRGDDVVISFAAAGVIGSTTAHEKIATGSSSEDVIAGIAANVVTAELAS